MCGPLHRLLRCLPPRQLLNLGRPASPGFLVTRMARISKELPINEFGNVYQPEDTFATNLE
jgi:hypothetical protein